MSSRVCNERDEIGNSHRFVVRLDKPIEVLVSPFHAHFGNFMKMIAELSLSINLVGLVCKVVIYI